MLAFGLCLILFVYWTVLGAALLWPLESRMDRLRKLLLAPVIGMAVNGLPLFVLNIAGIPVAKSAVPVGIVLLLGALFILRWNARHGERMAASFDASQPLWRQYLPFGGLLIAALVLTGRPMFLFNFDWMSFCNDDMANYCLGAHRVLDFGYFDRPDAEQLVRGRDYVQQMWFLHVPGKHRPGSEMIIAFMCGVTRMKAPEVFMVVILAMHLCQISALAALVYRKPEQRLTAWTAAALLGVSALASLGALYQLIAQVAGLALAIAAGVLLLRPMERSSFKEHVKAGTLIGVLIGALMVFYPEVFPFLSLTWLIYIGIGLVRRRLQVRPMLGTLGVATVVTILALNVYTSVSLSYLFDQVSSGTRSENPQQTLFPYYLMPSGLSNLWGIQPLATLALEPWQSLAIAAGALLLLAAGIAAVVWTWRGDPNATFALVMVVMGVYLFYGRAGFGLYKLAMYSQPFFCALLVTAWLSLLGFRRRGRWRTFLGATPIVGLCVPMVCTQYLYVRASCGVGQTFNEILDASDSRVFNEFRELVAANEKNVQPGGRRHQYLVDTYNLVLAKFQSIGNRGNEMAFPSNRFYYPGGYKSYPTPGGQDLIDAAYDLMADYNDQFRWEGFRVRGDVRPSVANASRAAVAPGDTPVDTAKDGDASNTFLFNKLAAEMSLAAEKGRDSKSGSGSDVTVVATTGKQSPFNRRHIGATPTSNFVALAAGDVKNHLVFVSSELGQPYFSGGRSKPNYAIYQLEAEPLFFRGRTMAGVGRHALFQLINPSKDPSTGRARVRMLLEMTGSYKGDSDNALPPARVIGNGSVGFVGLVGRGAARVISDPLEPQYINGQPYIEIDMGVEGKRFPEVRAGLMALFGRDVVMDRRSLVGFLRDISLVSEEEYEVFKPPVELSVFATKRNDLRDHPELEFSGIYEDGWVSESSYYRLSQPPQASQSFDMVIRGEVPKIPGGDAYFETKAALHVDGKLVAEQTVHLGRFELRGPVTPTEGTNPARRVELQFTRVQQLPPIGDSPDGRPVAARLSYVGFQTAAPPAAPVAHTATH